MPVNTTPPPSGYQPTRRKKPPTIADIVDSAAAAQAAVGTAIATSVSPVPLPTGYLTGATSVPSSPTAPATAAPVYLSQPAAPIINTQDLRPRVAALPARDNLDPRNKPPTPPQTNPAIKPSLRRASAAINAIVGTPGAANQPSGPPLFTREGPQYAAAAADHNMPFATKGPYQTQLPPAQEQQFEAWVQKNNIPFDPNQQNPDYNMRGFWQDGGRQPAPDGHFPDTYKTPYDTSFSAQSQYATKDNPFDWQGNRLIDGRSGQVVFNDAGARQTPGVTQALVDANGAVQSAVDASQVKPPDPRQLGNALRDPKNNAPLAADALRVAQGTENKSQFMQAYDAYQQSQTPQALAQQGVGAVNRAAQLASITPQQQQQVTQRLKSAVQKSAAPDVSQFAGAGPDAAALAKADLRYGPKFGVQPSVLFNQQGIESEWGANPGPSPAGAMGDSQFIPGTRDSVLATTRDQGLNGGQGFDAFASPRQAAAAQAFLLSQAGFAKDPQAAVFSYNHSQDYVDSVLGGASQYKALDSATAQPKKISDQLVNRAQEILGNKQTQQILGNADPTQANLAVGAAAPKGDPSPEQLSRYKNILKDARSINQQHYPYAWGGGHSGTTAQPGYDTRGTGAFGYDCSGVWSRLLQQSGIDIPPMTSGDLATTSALKDGPGKVSIYANGDHVFGKIGDHYFGTSSADNPGGGAGWITKATGDSMVASGDYTVRHVPGLGEKVAYAAAQANVGASPASAASPDYAPQIAAPGGPTTAGTTAPTSPALGGNTNQRAATLSSGSDSLIAALRARAPQPISPLDMTGPPQPGQDPQQQDLYGMLTSQDAAPTWKPMRRRP